MSDMLMSCRDSNYSEDGTKLSERQAKQPLAKVSFCTTKETLANFQVGKVDPVPAVSLDLGGFFSISQRGQGPPSRPENILKFIHCSQS
jgi:hypothetical protein